MLVQDSWHLSREFVAETTLRSINAASSHLLAECRCSFHIASRYGSAVRGEGYQVSCGLLDPPLFDMEDLLFASLTSSSARSGANSPSPDAWKPRLLA